MNLDVIPMNRISFVALLAAVALAQTGTRQPGSANEVVDRVIASEGQFSREIARFHPVIESYVQFTDTGADGKNTVTSDAYFVGKLNMGELGFNSFTFVPEKSGGFLALSFLKKSEKFRLFPEGFAQMAVLDPDNFNRDHYSFENLHEEFLGEIRCWVIDVTPRELEGRFVGRIWAEDRGYHIVRYSGTYGSAAKEAGRYFHFSGYRQEMRPGLWLPTAIYVEHDFRNLKRKPGVPGGLKAQVHLWSYANSLPPQTTTFTNIQVETPEPAQDHSATDISSTEALREWKREAEENVIQRMEKAGVLAPEGPMEKILDAVLNNLVVTNKIVMDPPARCRILLSTPLESCSIGHSIVLSRGLIDVLPNEATLAAMIARELAHMQLTNSMQTINAFANRVQIEDNQIFKQFSFRRTPEEERAANQKALELLKNSPYKDDLSAIGLFLAGLRTQIEHIPNLLKPNIGNGFVENGDISVMTELVRLAPPLAPQDIHQIPALSLGARLRVDPWDNRAEVVNAKPVAILTADEKMPFEVTPIVLILRRLESQAPASELK